jgi:SAM-dependent methyltransferase
VLDFGCGNSPFADQLRVHGHRVLAVDLRPPRRPHPDRLTGDLCALALTEAQFDLAYAYRVFEYLPEPQPYLDELLRLTKRGGMALIHTPAASNHRPGAAHPAEHTCPYRHRLFSTILKHKPDFLLWHTPWSMVIQK